MKIRTNCKSGFWGTYIRSCENTTETPQGDGSLLLTGRCQTLAGNYIPSSLIVPSDHYEDVANCNGILTLGGC